MAELPKIAIERLRAQQSGAAAGSHPDANSLSGFVEGGLSEPERAQMLAHLGSCAECREVVSLSLPEEESGAAVIPAREGVRSWGAGRWQWGAVATGVVIVASAVLLLNPKHTSRQDTVSQVRPDERIVASAPPPPPVLQDAARARGGVAKPEAPESKKSPRSLAFTRSPVVPSAAEPSARRTDADYYSANAAPPSAAAKSLADESKREANSAHGNVNASSKDKTQSTNGGVLGSVLESANAHGSESGVGGGTLKVSPSAPQIASSQQPASKATEQNVQAAPAPIAPPAVADSVNEKDKKSTDQAVIQSVGVTGAATYATSNSSITVPAGMNRLWRITPQGKLLTSSGRKDGWRQVDLGDDPKIVRLVYAHDPDIWFAGTNGRLYHSSDGGKGWSSVKGAWSTETEIVNMTFRDAQHGELFTLESERWITSDGGKSWQRP
jgi:hypothetical protein